MTEIPTIIDYCNQETKPEPALAYLLRGEEVPPDHPVNRKIRQALDVYGVLEKAWLDADEGARALFVGEYLASVWATVEAVTAPAS
jgi:hypothetical protein